MQLELLLPILNGLTACVFVLNGDRRILALNNAARKLFGEHLVESDFVLAIRDPNCLKAINKVLSGNKKSQTVIVLHKPVRTTYQVTVTRTVANNENFGEKDAAAVVSLENISHIFEAEQMRSEFVANVSHELRSPLTALNGFIETLKDAAKNDEQARERFLTIMEREATRMNRLIGDLLSLSKVEADAHLRPEAKVDICMVIEQVIALHDQSSGKQTPRIQLDCQPGVNTMVSGDADQLLQVFVNLVENAIKYGKVDGVVNVKVSQKEHAAGIRGAALQIEVIDQGAGISAEHLPRLTERFYRVDKGRSREMGGTGLGLAIVKHILARHRARLLIASVVGEGTTFTVLLPQSQ